MNKLHLMHNRIRDEVYTPPEAIVPLIPHLDSQWTIWELSEATGNISRVLKSYHFEVIGTNYDCLLYSPNYFDAIVSNPPYSIKTKILRRCYELGKPFALLLPMTALEGAERQQLYSKYGLQIILLNKRVKFEIFSGKQNPWFATAWFTNGLKLTRDIVYTQI
jgi:23S rRNA G2445 N2-methylase RlmL